MAAKTNPAVQSRSSPEEMRIQRRYIYIKARKQVCDAVHETWHGERDTSVASQNCAEAVFNDQFNLLAIVIKLRQCGRTCISVLNREEQMLCNGQ